MTNPYQPLQGLPGFGGGTAPLTGLPGFSPQQVQQPGTPGGSMFQAPTQLQEFDAARPVSNVGALETIATQSGRGLLDAVLGSGALAGAAAESLGAATGWKGIEDFGRDLGQASSGTAAMEAAAFLFGTGAGNKQVGLDYASRARNAIEEQEAAWPMLTAVSRIGGGVALAAATGGATGGLGLARLAGIGAYEGAGAGALQAYERNEALRDVLVSTVTGAAFGAAGGAAVHGIGKIPGAIGAAIDERNTLRQVFGDIKTAADDVADAVRQAGGKETYEAAKAVLKERAAVLAEVAKAGDNPSLIRQAYDKATRAAGQKLSDLAGEFDAGSWATKTPTAMQKLLHRTPILDRVSDDLAADAGNLMRARPSLDFDLKVPKKLLKDADGPAAIGSLQGRLTQAIEQMPDPRLRSVLLPFSERLQTAGAGDAMAAGHELARRLGAVAQAADVDEVTASYARRTAQALADELGSDAWGSVGKAYRALARADGQLDTLTPKALRDALKHADSSRAVPGAFAEEVEQLTGAFAARKQLGGQYMDEGTRKLLKEVTERAEKAHTAVTFDGAPAKRVLDVLSGAGRNIGESYASDLLGMGVGAAIGGVPGMLVARALAPVLGDVASAAFGKGIAKAGEKAGRGFATQAFSGVGKVLRESTKRSVSWQQNTYNESVERLADMVAMGSPESAATRERAIAELPPDIQGMATTDMQAKLTQLLQDLPKPQPNIRGKSFEMLSRGDLQKAQAMWEATMQPMSVFSDFTRGVVNYDKVQYAWKQYPGLKQAAQAGLADIIETQLGDEGKAKMSDGMLTQLDSLFGFDGALQQTSDRQFASRMSALGDAARQEQKPAPRPGKLNNPAAMPTHTQRLAGAQV